MTKAAQLKTTATVALAALAAALVSVVVAAHTPALAQKSTAADTRHPRVIDVRPAEGATDVSIVEKPYVYHRVVAYFSEDMRKLTVEKSFEAFKKGSNTAIAPSYGVFYNARKQAAILSPDYAPKRGVTYKAVVSTQAEDLAGNKLVRTRTVLVCSLRFGTSRWRKCSRKPGRIRLRLRPAPSRFRQELAVLPSFCRLPRCCWGRAS